MENQTVYDIVRQRLWASSRELNKKNGELAELTELRDRLAREVADLQRWINEHEDATMREAADLGMPTWDAMDRVAVPA